MIYSRHFAESLSRINQYRLGGLKAVTLFQNKLEIGRINAYVGSHAVIGIAFRSRGEITAVNQVKAVNIAVIFGCVFIANGNKRVMKGTAAAVTAVYTLITGNYRLSCNMPLP